MTAQRPMETTHMNRTMLRRTLLPALLLATLATLPAHAADDTARIAPTLDAVEAPQDPLFDPKADPQPPDKDPEMPAEVPLPDPYAGIDPPPAIDLPPEKGEWLRLTYLVYSGQPEPTVLLEGGSDVDRVEEVLAKITGSPDKVIDAYEPTPVLGYNGILIERFSDGVPRYSYALERDVLSTGSDGKDYALQSAATADLASLLLRIGSERKALDESMLAVIEQTLAEQARR
jgi:hypothetical protein